eukprot:1596495-Alexandrium_andersonii.AAC.1
MACQSRALGPRPHVCAVQHMRLASGRSPLCLCPEDPSCTAVCYTGCKCSRVGSGRAVRTGRH